MYVIHVSDKNGGTMINLIMIEHVENLNLNHYVWTKNFNELMNKLTARCSGLQKMPTRIHIFIKFLKLSNCKPSAQTVA